MKVGVPLPAEGGGRSGGQVSGRGRRSWRGPSLSVRMLSRDVPTCGVADGAGRSAATPGGSCSVGVSLCGSCPSTAMLPPAARSFVGQTLQSSRFRTGFAGCPDWRGRGRGGAGYPGDSAPDRFPGDGRFQGRPPLPSPAPPTLPVGRSSPSKAAIRRSNRCQVGLR